MTMTPKGTPTRRLLGWAFQHVVGDSGSWSTDIVIPLADFATAEASLNGYQAWAGGIGWAGIFEYVTEDPDTGKLKGVPAAGAQSGGYVGLAPYVADKNIHQVTIGLMWYADPGNRTDVGAWYSIWTFDVPLFQ
jgi:hypothetical protein